MDFTIPFGLVASVAPGGEGPDASRAAVTLYSGKVLQLERAGDLGAGNAGMLVFVEGRERPEYVPWPEIARIDFDPAFARLAHARATAGRPTFAR